MGGTGNWDATAGSKWSLTPGGPGGAAVPTASDDVFLNSESGVETTITVSADVACKNLDCVGFAGVLAGSSRIASSGTVRFVPEMVLSYFGQLFFTGASAALNTAGKTIGSLTTTLDAGGTFNLLSDVVMTGQLAHNVGTFNTNNFNISANNFSWGVNQTRTINLYSSTLTITSSAAGENMWSFDVATGCTFNAGTSTIIVAPTGAAGVQAVGPGAQFHALQRLVQADIESDQHARVGYLRGRVPDRPGSIGRTHGCVRIRHDEHVQRDAQYQGPAGESHLTSAQGCVGRS